MVVGIWTAHSQVQKGEVYLLTRPFLVLVQQGGYLQCHQLNKHLKRGRSTIAVTSLSRFSHSSQREGELLTHSLYSVVFFNAMIEGSLY